MRETIPPETERTFRPWRWLNRAFGVIGLLLASVICAPQLLAFPHHADIGTTRVYAERPIDVPAMRPVLARADVSLAMGQGALVSRAQADAVIVSNRPLDLVRAQHTARRAMRIVRQNLFWAATYNASCIPLALAGWLPPWAAGLGMALSSLFVIFNALRAGR